MVIGLPALPYYKVSLYTLMVSKQLFFDGMMVILKDGVGGRIVVMPLAE